MLISSVFRGQIKVEDAELGTVRDVRGEGKPDKCGVLEDIGEVGEVWRVELSSMLNVSERSHNIRDKKKKTLAPWKKSFDTLRQRIKKQRHYFSNKSPSSQSYW